MNNLQRVESWQQGLEGIFTYVPQIIGAIILLIIGYLIAKLLQSVVRRLLQRMHFDRAMHSSMAGNYVARVIESPSRFVGSVIFWIIFLAFITFAMSSLSLPILHQIVSAIYDYVPRAIAAIVIFLIASAISAGTAGFVQRVMGKTPTGDLISAIVPAVVMSIAGFMILSELRIAPEIVNITYTALMGSLALGLALAFGLGGRDVAKDILDQAYAAGQRHATAAKNDMKTARANTKAEAENLKRKG